MRSLDAGKCDAVIAQRLMGTLLLKKMGMKTIVPMDLVIHDFRQDFCFAVRDGDRDLLAKLNEGLSIVIAEGTFDRLHKKWFGPLLERRVTFKDVGKYVVIIFIPFVIVLGGALLVILRLQVKRRTDSLIREIEMRERAEKELKGSYDRQNSILTAIPDIIMEVNNDKVYTWANQAGYDFFGDDVIGKEAARYFIGDQKTYDIVQPVFTGDEKAVYVESWQRRKDGQKRLLAWYCTSRKDDSGAIIGAFSSARDITEHNIAEDALRKIRQDLERRVGELEVFHEITMGRESRIVELKNEMEKLKAELARYKKDR